MCTWSCKWRYYDVTVLNFTGETSAKSELLTKTGATATGMPITTLKLIKFNEKMQTVSNNVCMLQNIKKKSFLEIEKK